MDKSIERIRRNREIRQMSQSGKTIKEIALAMGLHHERVRQILVQQRPDPDERRLQMPREILNHLSELGNRLGRMPRKQDIEADGKYTLNQICHRFGNLSKARRLAGVQNYNYELLALSKLI